MFGWEGVCEFVSVAEQGGFTPAARKLGVSVAQVSRQVAQLEDRLQAKLLLRTTRQVRLTELGEIYFRHCRQLLDNLYEAEHWGAIRRCHKGRCASRPPSPTARAASPPW